ncbi:unnamed protein product [Adineta steineri]|uniref:Uncharacterized protein n=1 Tax=Adineta steineri TaxID=433720 RepID=A0A819AYT3_9BILA|nr:unnamed protein product [Adineta steineri]CAF1262250.1 unnamed protein product [Adineta steineri]CAF3787836.1 unnamed protein product [Adineta steineri]
MHWISLISFAIIIYICQAQPSTFKQFETESVSKDGTFDVVSDDSGIYVSEAETVVDSTVQTIISHAPIVVSVKHEQEGRESVQIVANSGNKNYCYMILPLIIAGLMAIV